MKFTLTAVLVSAVVAGDDWAPKEYYKLHADNQHPVWGLRSVNDHKSDSDLQIEFGNHATSQADARPPLRSHIAIHGDDDEESDSESDDDVQLNDDDEEVDHSKETFKAGEHGTLGASEYERVTPARFSDDKDDIFMRSVIEQYAQECKNKDGSPNGQFVLDESNAYSLAREVLDTHRKLTGEARDNYLKTYFKRTWEHFDVNRTGKVEAIKMPQFMRFLCSDQQMYLW